MGSDWLKVVHGGNNDGDKDGDNDGNCQEWLMIISEGEQFIDIGYNKVIL